MCMFVWLLLFFFFFFFHSRVGGDILFASLQQPASQPNNVS